MSYLSDDQSLLRQVVIEDVIEEIKEETLYAKPVRKSLTSLGLNDYESPASDWTSHPIY